MSIEEDIKGHFNDEFHRALVNVIFTHNSLMERLSVIFKQSDITKQQFNVLRILKGQYPGAVSIGVIKERMLDKMSDSSRIVDRLHKKGLVERSVSPEDRRSAEIRISPKGLMVLGEINPKVDIFSKSLSKKITEQEAILLNKLLDKIR